MIEFFDLNKQYKKISRVIGKDLNINFTKGDFIQGENVKLLEKKLLKFTSSKYCLSCANGTDAIKIAINSLSLKKNTYIIIPSYTWISTASSVIESGLKPIFCDIDLKTFVIDSYSLEKCIKYAKKKKYKISALISVDLFGNPVDYLALNKICKKEKIKFISDAAQSFGAKYKGKYVGSDHCDVLTTSFFPTKTIGCYGDGGAVFFNNSNTYAKAKMYAKNGQWKGNLLSSGINSRLDTIQATILISKLKLFHSENLKRQRIYKTYKNKLNKDVFELQKIYKQNISGNSVFTIFLKNNIKRETVIKYLKSKRVPYKVYYAKPIHTTEFYKKFPNMPMFNTLELSKKTISLPIYSYATLNDITKICKIVNDYS